MTACRLTGESISFVSGGKRSRAGHTRNDTRGDRSDRAEQPERDETNSETGLRISAFSSGSERARKQASKQATNGSSHGSRASIITVACCAIDRTNERVGVESSRVESSRGEKKENESENKRKERRFRRPSSIILESGPYLHQPAHLRRDRACARSLIPFGQVRATQFRPDQLSPPARARFCSLLPSWRYPRVVKSTPRTVSLASVSG